MGCGVGILGRRVVGADCHTLLFREKFHRSELSD